MEPQTGNVHTFDLEAKKLQLHWLLQITKAINYNLPSDKLFEIYSNVLKDHLKVGRMLLFANEGYWHVPVKYGIELEPDYNKADKILEEIINFSDAEESKQPWLKQFETIVPVIHKENVLAYALIGNIDKEVFHSKREIVTYIHTITNLIVVAIENHRLVFESIKQAAMEKELELAAQMQSLLFPTNLVSQSIHDIAATYIPHQSVGGDYYDFIPLNENEAFICIADVSGKGMSAAMLMANFQANLHAIIKHTDFSLEDIVIELNRCVNRSAKGEKFITLFIGKINHSSGEIEYINAGHNAPIIIDGSNSMILDKGTTGLGMLDELPFINKGYAKLTSGSILFCYTDGITEMENNAGHFFGTDLLTGLLVKNTQVGSMELLHKNMVQSFDEFRENTGYSDDVTFLSIRFSG